MSRYIPLMPFGAQACGIGPQSEDAVPPGAAVTTAMTAKLGVARSRRASAARTAQIRQARGTRRAGLRPAIVGP